ncbi:MAG: hypothetical protein K2R98_06075 [Gemmataceae bacterium]|nr:hypothetical protein [Gemmataceae bacterium]
MLTLVTCPTCHHKFTIPEDAMGHRRTCPNCQSIFVAGKSVAETNGRINGASRPGLLERAAGEDRASKPPIDQTMLGEVAAPIRYNCPRCKKPLESPAGEAGTKKPCPSCGGRLQVPAAPPPPAPDPGLNKTLLASAEGGPAQPIASPASVPIPALQPAAVATVPAALAPTGKSGTEILPSRAARYAIGALAAACVAFAVLYFNGKHNAAMEYDKLLQAQKQELDKLKADIDQKTTALAQQQQLEAQQRRLWEEQKAKQDARQNELEKERAFELQKLALLNDQKQAAEAKARFDERQKELEAERKAAAEKREQSEREMRAQMDALKRQLDNANNKTTTIITQPPPPAYPWWHHYYGRYPW